MTSGSDAAIAVLATLDSKGPEAGFVAEEIRAAGRTPLIVDVGLAGEPSLGADISRVDIAARGGARLGVHLGESKATQMSAIVEGGTQIIRERLAQGRLAGLIGLGGGQGSWLCSTIMRALPRGVPKVLVSTAGAAVGQYTRNSDIVPFFSVTDLAGLNRLVKPVLRQAAATVCALATLPPEGEEPDRPAVGLTMYGVTTTGAIVAKRLMEAAGLEVLSFHANGSGGQTFEHIVGERLCSGVLDWSITELADELVGGICTAGPRRLEAAGSAGVAQVVIPGGIDVVNLGGPRDVPASFADRVLHAHTPDAILMRTSPEENNALGALVAKKLNAARAPVRVLLPERGFSALSVPSGPFFMPAADTAFMLSLEAAIRPTVSVQRLPLHINDVLFAQAAAHALLDLLDRQPANQSAMLSDEER